MANFVYVSTSTVLRYSSKISYSLLAETSTVPFLSSHNHGFKMKSLHNSQGDCRMW